MKSSETSQPTMDTLRHAFARCCKILGLDQETCLNLILLLQSRTELATMVCMMYQAEEEGEKWGTTEVVLAAEKIKDYFQKHPELIQKT